MLNERPVRWISLLSFAVVLSLGGCSDKKDDSGGGSSSSSNGDKDNDNDKGTKDPFPNLPKHSLEDVFSKDRNYPSPITLNKAKFDTLKKPEIADDNTPYREYAWVLKSPEGVPPQHGTAPSRIQLKPEGKSYHYQLDMTVDDPEWKKGKLNDVLFKHVLSAAKKRFGEPYYKNEKMQMYRWKLKDPTAKMTIQNVKVLIEKSATVGILYEPE